MNVTKINLIYFRNLTKINIDFNSSLNIFLGNNAQGKSNIIEAIYFLLKGSSYRTNEDKNLINWNKKRSFILGEVNTKRDEIYNINILLEENIENNQLKKSIKINKKNKNKKWLNKKFKPVIFMPEDLQIIKNSPVFRRRFLDEVIISIKPIYYKYLKDYNHILFQRNTLLKTEKNKEKIDRMLVVWDQKLVEAGTLIILNRIMFLKKINQKAKLFHQTMTKNKETIKLIYNSNVLDNYTEDKNEIIQILINKIEKNRQKDIQLKMSSIGPHRDDFFVMNENIDLGIFGSQGQQRTAVLSLKLAELELFKEEDDDYPPLLLDDVMSELDTDRRIYLIKLIQDRKIQTFITSININSLTKMNIENEKIFSVSQGAVTVGYNEK